MRRRFAEMAHFCALFGWKMQMFCLDGPGGLKMERQNNVFKDIIIMIIVKIIIIYYSLFILLNKKNYVQSLYQERPKWWWKGRCLLWGLKLYYAVPFCLSVFLAICAIWELCVNTIHQPTILFPPSKTWDYDFKPPFRLPPSQFLFVTDHRSPGLNHILFWLRIWGLEIEYFLF